MSRDNVRIVTAYRPDPEKWEADLKTRAAAMKCHVCGANMSATVTDLPFKVTKSTIVILKGLPVFQCDSCSEYLLDDSVLERVETILSNVDTAAELEVITFAA